MPITKKILNFIDNVNAFIETCTSKNETIEYITNNTNISTIHGIESSQILYNEYKSKFSNNPRINLHYGNSKSNLYNIIKNIEISIVFSLDNYCLNELEQIENHSVKSHIILINNIYAKNKNEDENIKKIINKILEINPKYEKNIIYVDNMLVAFLPQKNCIHRYLLKCKNNIQSPGFGDFLRGTIALYQYSKKFDYNIYIDANIHPVFEFFEINEHFLYSNIDGKTIELCSPMSYEDILKNLNELFNSNKSFITITNSLFKSKDDIFKNYEIKCNENEKQFVKKILNPKKIIREKINNIFENIYKINQDEPYKIIHMRFGDNFLYDQNNYDETLIEKYKKLIKDEINNNLKFKYILLTDSCKMGNLLKEKIPELLYWNNKKIHIGDLCNDSVIISNNISTYYRYDTENIDIYSKKQNIEDSLVDFFIMQNASEIITFESLYSSFFSYIITIIYDIPYKKI